MIKNAIDRYGKLGMENTAVEEQVLLIFTLAPRLFFALYEAFNIGFMRPKNNGEHHKRKRYPVAFPKEIVTKRQGCV